jgi:DNA mismatch endonuclease (patch repair protein)
MPSTRAKKRRGGFQRLECRTDLATSVRMAGIRQRDTKPELIVRRELHALGHRFRVRNQDLPGSPDIANRSRGWVVFVHGCFWHRHDGCSRTTTPKRNRAFWVDKFETNQRRDAARRSDLQGDGFHVLVVWECETSDPLTLRARLHREISENFV